MRNQLSMCPVSIGFVWEVCVKPCLRSACFAATLAVLCLAGCGRSNTGDAAANPEMDLAPAAEEDTTRPSEQPQASAQGSGQTQNSNSPPPSIAGPANSINDVTRGSTPVSDPGAVIETPQRTSVPYDPGLQLKADLSPARLVDFLGEADRELRALINGQSGITDPQAAESEMKRVVALKRAASQRLMEHPDVPAPDRVTGQRGFLQSLSHQASMGDLRAAEDLQDFAEKFRDDPNAQLRSDAQLVLIGFAIESLRHGKSNAAERVLQLVEELMDDERPVDVASLMVLGQAKDTLLQYERIDEASEIRKLILAKFGDSQNDEVARMAAMIASSGFSQVGSAIERLDQLRQQFVDDARLAAEESAASSPEVTVPMWTEAVEAVVSQSADLLTAEFLAGVALEAEVVGRGDIGNATYEILSAKFSDRKDALGRVARTALKARENRVNVVGELFDPDLPSVSGKPLKMSDYRGKIVLMPFWSTAFPDSLMVLPNLLEIQKRHPGQVEVVGMNLDVEGTSVSGFVAREGLDFPSFRSVSDPSAEIVNEVAYRFGAVTLLFVAVIDQEGRVSHLDFSGGDLMSEVEKLIR
ncbi:thiol-disulfide isomerase/thioredoxin [Rhodopirellula rubra]|uniref:Thiol-disulfide isomerase/thioredoxin n=1 Tax=Aporhodopirellula rubra TaxID=980271 RepID=A0A7W5H622_9BACT|nr:TlpA disulfide reductase family protein [Aporhodopirellula rubra]MBB3206451.1 thiol-disulfide isomerase/thioredoxin [Aporhodopirellula rubra]